MAKAKKNPCENPIEVQTPFGVLSSHMDRTVMPTRQSNLKDLQTCVSLDGEQLIMRPAARAVLRSLIQAAIDHTDNEAKSNIVKAESTIISDIRIAIKKQGVDFDPIDLIVRADGGGAFIKVGAPALEAEADVTAEEESEEEFEIERNTHAGILRMFRDNGKDIFCLNDEPLYLTDFEHAALSHLMTHSHLNDQDRIALQNQHKTPLQGSHLVVALLRNKFKQTGANPKDVEQSIVDEREGVTLKSPMSLLGGGAKLPPRLQGWS